MHERFADDLLITCDETSNIPEGAKVIPRNEINYWLIAIFCYQLPIYYCWWSSLLSIYETQIYNFILISN